MHSITLLKNMVVSDVYSLLLENDYMCYILLYMPECFSLQHSILSIILRDFSVVN